MPSPSTGKRGHAHAPAHKLNLDRKAEKMVEEVRLKNIEREHKSLGALMDHRTMIPLVAPKVRQGSLQAVEAHARQSERRDAVETSQAMLESSQGAIKNMLNKGIAIAPVDNYENEELIWATKSRDPAYSQKRKYYHKDLQEFKDRLTAEQRVQFKNETHDRLVAITEKYRTEMKYMKEEMDIAGIFHPDANAHRAHCMYLMKLYKGIRSDTIEDPVLRKLREEENAKKRADEDEERRQRELLESIENKTKGIATTSTKAAAAPPPGAEIEAAPAPAPASALTVATSERKPTGSKKQVRLAESASLAKLPKASAAASASASGGGASTLPPPALKKSQSLPASVSVVSSKKKSGAEAPDPPAAAAAAAATPATAAGASVAEEKSTSSDADHHAGGDSKLFSKIKRGKMAASDPKTLLLEEAARLERSEVLDVKKVRERSSLVDEEMTNWMLGLLQTNQVEKTAQGREVVPTTVDLFASSLAAATSASSSSHADEGGHDEASAPYSPNKASDLPADFHSSQRMVPFGEFYDMFRAYSAEAKERKERELEKERKRQEKEAKRLLNKHHHGHHGHDGGHEDGHGHSRTRSSSLGGGGSGGEGEEAAAAAGTARSAGGPHDADNAYPMHQHQHQHEHQQPPHSLPPLHETDASVSITGSGSGSQQSAFVPPPRKIDLVQTMKDTDPQFEEYYKMMLRQKPQGARLFKGAGMKIPKLRAMAPLGKSAVTITDSKGSEKAISSKGFYNLFTSRGFLDESSGSATLHTLQTEDKTRDDDFSIVDGADPTGTGTGTGANTGISAAGRGESSRMVASPSHIQQPLSPSFPGASPPSTANAASRRTPSPSNARRSRNRSRGKTPSGGDGGKLGGTGDAAGAPDFQTKLVCVWDALQMPALNRLAFMRKYATKAFASELSRATDLWGEATVLVLARLNLVERNKTKVKEGFAVLPLLAHQLYADFMESVPAVLTSEAPSVCFQASEVSPLSRPLSVVMLAQINGIIQDCVPSSSDAPSAARTLAEAGAQLEKLDKSINDVLLRSVATILEEFNDTVTFNGLPVNAPAPPPPASPKV